MTASHLDQRLAAQLIDEALDYAIFTLDFDGRITTWNAGGERVLGYTADEAIGMNFAALFGEADQAANAPAKELETVRTEGRAEDSRWHVRRDGSRFWANGVAMRISDPERTGILKILRDETPARLAEEQRILLLNELNHRIKNTLAIVQSIADQTLRTATSTAAARESLTDRLMALSAAHNVLVNQSWAGAELGDVINRSLEAYKSAEDRIVIDGPPLRLSPDQAVSISMALHELATNALKYGGLRDAVGGVTVTWNLWLDENGARHMTLLWRERTSRLIEPPTRRGFGSRLLETTFHQSRGGSSSIEYNPDGLSCVLELALSSEGELPMMDLSNTNKVK